MFKEILATYLFTKLLGEKRTRELGIRVQKYTIRIAAVIFGLVAIAHSIRFALGIDANIVGWAVPLWISFVAAVVAGYLAFSLWKIK